MPLVIVRYPKRSTRNLQYFLREKNNLVRLAFCLSLRLACCSRV